LNSTKTFIHAHKNQASVINLRIICYDSQRTENDY